MTIILTRHSQSDFKKPHFLSATVLPENGMHLLQIRAFLPALGEVDLLSSPDLTQAKSLLKSHQNEAFKMGCAILLPYANRIRGKLLPDGKNIQTSIAAQEVVLPANWQGKKPDAEKHAIHGLMLSSPFEQLQQTASTLKGVLHAGDFDGHWPSQTQVDAQITLEDFKLTMVVTAKNVGKELLPIGIGAHPYFVLPSGDRKQARLHMPSGMRALVNNYDDVFPTGELVSVKDTPFDFTAKEGRALGDLYLDDSFTQLKRHADNAAAIMINDPAADYRLRITAESPEIKTIHMYAPPDKNFIAIEPQFNVADPRAEVWGDVDTGMALLKPNEAVTWKISLELS
jgi:aldose 1-epimerase